MPAIPLLLALMFLAATAAMCVASEQSSPQVAERDLGEVRAALAVGDPLAVFTHLMRELPERAIVLPTENYYYVRFSRRGVNYSGNIRLAAADRDNGTIHLAYGVAPTDRRPSPRVRHARLGQREGVTIAGLSPFAYRVEFRGRSVIFELNDLSMIRPPEYALRQDERFVGTIFDESGVRFFLVFNSRLRVFHYLLDETVAPADQWTESGDATLVGRRTGFALYRDGERKVLVGVGARHSRLNTMFDGPFDQLPENSIAGDTLRDAIVAADPLAKGKIDRLGNYLDGSGRYLIHPYLPYRSIGDLAVFHHCMTSVPQGQKPRCLVVSNEESQRRKPLPLALQGR